MVRNLLQALFDEPDGPLLGPAGLAAGTQATAFARKRQQPLVTATGGLPSDTDFELPSGYYDYLEAIFEIDPVSDPGLGRGSTGISFRRQRPFVNPTQHGLC